MPSICRRLFAAAPLAVAAMSIPSIAFAMEEVVPELSTNALGAAATLLVGGVLALTASRRSR